MCCDGLQCQVIRVYPLSNNEFKDIYEVKCYFDCRLKYEHNGKFYCNTIFSDIQSETLVLFQYDSQIVACALYVKSKENDSSNSYKKHMLFDVKSIKYLDRPIKNQEFENITSKKLQQGKLILDDIEINKSLIKRLGKQDEINN